MRELDWYRTMARIRAFEERMLELHAAGHIAGSVHPCLGQEAIPVGAVSGAGQHQIVATYRGHGWAIAAGVPLQALFSEICGRASGTNGGRGGSAYLSAPDHGFLGETSIVGAGVPIAGGVALTAQQLQTDTVSLVSFGDGATSQGATHEGMVFAAHRSLPVIYLCENNGWSEMTPIDAVARVDDLTSHAKGLGIFAEVVDGNGPGAVHTAVAAAARRARAGNGPTFLECKTHRLGAHYQADIEHYRPPSDRQRAIDNDPLLSLRRVLAERGISEDDLREIDAEIASEVDATAQDALAAEFPDPRTATHHVLAPIEAPHRSPAGTGREMSTWQAINEALRIELETRPEVVLFGEDIALPGGVFGVTRNLAKRFGNDRVFDTPIAESAILGAAVGSAMTGLRPVVEIMWADFLLVALDQLINQAANVRYLNSGRLECPLVVRTQQGATPGSCAQHSQSLEALLAHIPGLIVGVPSTPQDAFSMLRSAIASPDPVILFESRAQYQSKGPVDLSAAPEPTAGAQVVRTGSDCTVVAWGPMVSSAVDAADQLADDGLEVGVVDVRWLNPLDIDTLANAAAQSGRVLVAHQANVVGGFGAEIASQLHTRLRGQLLAPVERLGLPNVRIPASPVLQDALVPDSEDVIRCVRALVAT